MSGVETLKALAGAVGVASFTVLSLAERTGVSRDTIDTVLRRYSGAFQKLGPVVPGRRGRPQVRWRLRPEAIDEVVAEVEKLQLAIGPERSVPADTSEEADLVKATLMMAADSVMRAPADDLAATRSFVAAARASLLAAGFDRVVGGIGSDLQTEADPQGQYARLISAVADVVEADATGEPGRIDAAQAKALRLVEETKSDMLAEQWLPLANRVVEAPGTVLAAPVAIVDPAHESLIEKLFPRLVRVSAASLDLSPDEDDSELTTRFLADSRLTPATPAIPLALVILQVVADPVMGTVAATAVSTLFTKAARRLAPSAQHRSAKCVLVAKHVDTAIMSTITDNDARLVLIRGPRETQTNFARVVNRMAVGLDA